MSSGIADGQGDAPRRTRRAVVIVQGDLGRSPRMQYHAYALAVNGARVDFVGFAGAALPSAIRDHGSIAVHGVSDVPPVEPGSFFATRAAARALRQAGRLAGTLLRLPAADLVLVQTPPSVPAAVLAWLLARRRGARFVLDWHNLGWTLFALNAGPAGVALLRAIENWVGRRGDAHICVSRAMQAHLADTVGAQTRVVYDRAPEWFALPPVDRQRAVRARLFTQCGVSDTAGAALVVSPTSFTPDEDLDLLFDAADLVEGQRAALPRGFPRLLVLATGGGPGRAAFEARATARPRDALVIVRTAWVEADDYPALLASADAGVCTHRSSSGLDLPMKVADMFGAGLPVIALGYPALAERVRDRDMGMLFADAAGLSRTWRTLFAPAGAQTLAALRRASAAAGQDRWLEGWNNEAAPTLI
jgi:beta-1,4-mannosyltransferase